MNTTETKVELLPCPFCGGINIVLMKDEDGAHIWHTHYCHDCGCQTGVGLFISEEKSAESWNRRTPDQSAIQEAREALMDSIKAAEYVVQLIEQTGKAGESPNPTEKADWLGAAMHCYAAMSFVQKARQALEKLG